MIKSTARMRARSEKDRQEHRLKSREIAINSTLEQLDGERWGEPAEDSYVVTTCLLLRRKPVGTLTDEELRLAIGQAIGIEWLVPLALERLTIDPFRSGDFYDGDLLIQVVTVPSAYWTNHPAEERSLKIVLRKAVKDGRFSEIDKEARETVLSFVANA